MTRESFFQQQERARRRSQQLVLGFHLVVALTALATTLFYLYFSAASPQETVLVFGTVYLMIWGVAYVRALPLKQGGAAVAALVGGREVSFSTKDFQERQLINVVEEMSIASGAHLPRVFIVEDPSINAFAAGMTSFDACVAVNRGALTQLTRDELQAVVAHEFSHILNGDMALNVRLLGNLYGLTSITDLGRFLLRLRSNRRQRGNDVLPLFGLGLVLIGGLGYFFAYLLRAGVSRDRERLADASAVQFTRNSEGLANALRKIWRASMAPAKDTRAGELAHFYFHWPRASFFGWLATHPPLVDRIRALGVEPQATDRTQAQLAELDPLAAVSRFAPAAAPKLEERAQDPLHLAYLFYLWLEPHPQLGPVDALVRWNKDLSETKLRELYEHLHTLSQQEKFVLLEISLAKLRAFPPGRVRELLGQIRALIEEDRQVTVCEFIYYDYLCRSLLPRKKSPAFAPSREAFYQALEACAWTFARIVAAQRRSEWVAEVLRPVGRTPASPRSLRSSELSAQLDVLAAGRPFFRQVALESLEAAFVHAEQTPQARMALSLLQVILKA